MSEQATEATRPVPRRFGKTGSQPTPARPAGQTGGASFLMRKYAGFPVWAWAAIIGGLLVWRMYAAKKSPAAASTSTATSTSTANQIPQFVNQTYTTLTAPSAPGTNGVPLTTAPSTSTATSTSTGWPAGTVFSPVVGGQRGLNAAGQQAQQIAVANAVNQMVTNPYPQPGR